MNGGATKAPGGPERGQAFPVGSLVVLACQEAHGGGWRGPMEVVEPDARLKGTELTVAVHARRGRGAFCTDMLVPYTGPSIPTKLKACAALLLKGEVHGLVAGAQWLGWDPYPLFRALGDWWPDEWVQASDEECATFLLFCAEALREEPVAT